MFLFESLDRMANLINFQADYGNTIKFETFTVFKIHFYMFQSISDMVAMERPDWPAVFSYVTSIYKHFEVDCKTP